MAMSCRLLSQNEKEALGQDLRQILEPSSLLKSTGRLPTTKAVRRSQPNLVQRRNKNKFQRKHTGKTRPQG